jgi:hypothetical protein
MGWHASTFVKTNDMVDTTIAQAADRIIAIVAELRCVGGEDGMGCA